MDDTVLLMGGPAHGRLALTPRDTSPVTLYKYSKNDDGTLTLDYSYKRLDHTTRLYEYVPPRG